MSIDIYKYKIVSGILNTKGEHTLEDGGIVYDYLKLKIENKNVFLKNVTVLSVTNSALSLGHKITLYYATYPHHDNIKSDAPDKCFVIAIKDGEELMYDPDELDLMSYKARKSASSYNAAAMANLFLGFILVFVIIGIFFFYRAYEFFSAAKHSSRIADLLSAKNTRLFLLNNGENL